MKDANKDQDLFHEYLKAYMEVQAASGKLLSAKNELAKRAKALCDKYAVAAKGNPIVVNSPIGIISLTLDETYFATPSCNADYFSDYSNGAVKLQELQQIQDVEEEVLSMKKR